MEHVAILWYMILLFYDACAVLNYFISPPLRSFLASGGWINCYIFVV